MSAIVPGFNVATMTSREIAERLSLTSEGVANGTASFEDACANAMFFVGIVVSSFASVQSIASKNDFIYCDELKSALAVSAEARVMARSVSNLFLFYPYCLKMISDAVTSSCWAESLLVALLAKNSDRSAQIIKTYIVKNKTSGLIKIGRSINPDARLKSLQTGAGCELDVIAVIDGDVESELHQRFSTIRVYGEWFMDDGAILEFALSANSWL